MLKGQLYTKYKMCMAKISYCIVVKSLMYTMVCTFWKRILSSGQVDLSYLKDLSDICLEIGVSLINWARYVDS